ncbi:MAG: hypothetical protein C0405_14030 [Desulfovibrio sp.]|nr:hypothetical protein [Desulfovibrio sp.]
MVSKSSWEQREALENLEIERELEAQGLRESAQLQSNWLDGDTLGLEDGRPGMSWGPGGLYMPLEWRQYLRIGLILLFVALALLVRMCFGSGATPAGTSAPPPGAPGASAAPLNAA